MGAGCLCQMVRITLAARTPVLDCPPQHIQLVVFFGALTRYPHSKGSGAPVPTATPLAARWQRHTNTSPRPTGSRAPAPTSTPPVPRFQRHSYTYPHSTGNGAHAPTAICPGARRKRNDVHVSSSHGQSCARAHFNTSRQGLTLVHFHLNVSTFCEIGGVYGVFSGRFGKCSRRA